ncbi:hypothetical protein PN36_35275, partial [Candidatus Thiomargarita nelsonii]
NGGHVSEIDLGWDSSSNNLTGSIPPELAQLSNLTVLLLDSNSLTGSIPPELAQLSNLKYLWLNENQLCGEIPSDLMNLTNLLSSPDGLRLQTNNLINTDTEYPADFVTWLDQINPDWRTQVSPTYCSLLQFSATNYNINEGDSAATITVTRTENSLGAVSLEYATSDETATAPNDYSQTTGTLNWADGDTADKTFTVDIIDDSEQESHETFSVSLGNPTGGAELGEPAVVTITDNDTIQKTLSVTKTGNGTITSTPTGINCGTDCTEDYNTGTEVTLTATPEAGSTFTGWSGDCNGTGNCVVTMNNDLSVTATFQPDQKTLSVTKNGTGNGTITSTPTGINCGTDCTENY